MQRIVLPTVLYTTVSTLQVYSVVEILVTSTYMDIYKSSSFNICCRHLQSDTILLTLYKMSIADISYVCVTVVYKALF